MSRATLMICQFIVPIIEEQKKNGHYVCVCGSNDEHVQKLESNGIDVFPHELRRGLNLLNIIQEIFRIRRVLIEHKIDVLVCHSPLGAGVGRIAGKLAKVPNIIYYAHGMPCAPGQNCFLWLSWFVVEWLLGFCTTAILVMNNYDERLCKKFHIINPKKIIRIPGMGVDLNKFSDKSTEEENRKLKTELGIPLSAKLVLCIAYVIPEKGVFVFADAAKLICAKRKDVFFLLAGTGPCQQRLQDLVDSNGLTENFKLLGWRNDIYRLMKNVDIFTLPTYYFEGLPVSILEAMACAKPVIATKHRGCEDSVVDGKTGFLIPIKASAPLVEKIELLVNDESLKLKMGMAGRERIENEFEINNCTVKIVQAIDSIYNSR